MVLKLKLKIPSGGPNDNEETPAQSSQQSTPKIKIKAPSSNKDNGSASKGRKTTKDKTKKIKIKLNSENDDNITSGLNDVARAARVPKVRIKPTRIPGEGYDSEAPDLEDDPLIEHGIVVRFLDDANLDFVHNAVESGDLTGLNIKWVSKDKAIVNITGTLYSARLVELPTVTEFYKTIDRKNIFKTLDVCQILLVLHTINPSELNVEKDFEVPQESTYSHPLYNLSPNAELKPTSNVYIDGLIYPFTDIHRRFRPRRFNHRVIQDVNQKVDELIRLDEEAEESHFEIIDLTQQHRQGFGTTSGTPSASSTPAPVHYSSNVNLPKRKVTENTESHLDEGELEEELAKVLEGNDNLVGQMVGDNVLLEADTEEGDDVEVEDKDDDDDDDDEDDDDDDEDEGDEEENADEVDEKARSSKQHVKMLEEEIAELENAVEVHRKGLASATHKMMKMKFQTSYNTLKASLDSKKRDLAKLVNDQKILLSDNTKDNQTKNVESGKSDQQEKDNSDSQDGEGEGDADGDDDDANNSFDDMDDLF